MNQIRPSTHFVTTFAAITAALLLSPLHASIKGQGAGRQPEPVATNKTSPAKVSAGADAARARARAAKERQERQDAEERAEREREERRRAERESAAERAARIDAENRRKALEASLPSAAIKSVWTKSNIIDGGNLGLEIHVAFDMKNLKNVECKAGAFFHDANGAELRDNNGNYTTTEKQIYTGVTVRPVDNETSFKDLAIFIPYKELHLLHGDHSLKFELMVWYGDKVLAKSDWVAFTVSSSQLASAQNVTLKPSGKIEAITVRHNATLAGLNGMMISFKLTLDNVKDVACFATAQFVLADGTVIKGNAPYAAENGGLMLRVDFTPIFYSSYFEKFELFLPYNQLHLPAGRHTAKFTIAIYAAGHGYFLQTGWNEFDVLSSGGR